jgi:hypothetical protein
MILMDLGASLFRMLLAAPAEATIFWVFAGLAAVKAHTLVSAQHPISARGT